MARTSQTRRIVGSGEDAVARQAPAEVWSPSDLLAALKKPSPARKQELLREAGILDAKGKLAKKYRSWGDRVSRTMIAGNPK